MQPDFLPPSHAEYAALEARALIVTNDREIDAALLAHYVQKYSDHPTAAATIRRLNISPRMLAPPSFLAANQSAADALRHVVADTELWTLIRAAWLALLRIPASLLTVYARSLDDRLEAAAAGLGLVYKRPPADASAPVGTVAPHPGSGGGDKRQRTADVASTKLPSAQEQCALVAAYLAEPPPSAHPPAPTPEQFSIRPVRFTPPIPAPSLIHDINSPLVPAEPRPVPYLERQPRPDCERRHDCQKEPGPTARPHKRSVPHLVVRATNRYHRQRRDILGDTAVDGDVPVCHFHGCAREWPLRSLNDHVSRPIHELCSWQTFFCVEHMSVMEQMVQQKGALFCNACGATEAVYLRPEDDHPRAVPLCDACNTRSYVIRQLCLISRRRKRKPLEQPDVSKKAGIVLGGGVMPGQLDAPESAPPPSSSTPMPSNEQTIPELESSSTVDDIDASADSGVSIAADASSKLIIFRRKALTVRVKY